MHLPCLPSHLPSYPPALLVRYLPRSLFMCAVGAAVAEVRLRAAFFKQTFLSPLTFNLGGFPPLLLISGTRDFYYSDRCDLLRIPVASPLATPLHLTRFLVH
jgi:hypothetical protein